MEKWKVKQEIYHRLNKQYDDDLENFDVEITDDTVGDAIKYFTEDNVGWLYPAKSYMVGICYAKWLSEDYGGQPLDYLNDKELLYGNDPYFVTYNEDKETYDNILNVVGWDFKNIGIVPDVRKYYELECGIE